MPHYHEKGLVGNRSIRCYHVPSTAAIEHLFYFTHSGYFFVNKDYHIQREEGMLFESYMLMFTVSGTMYLDFEGQTYTAEANELLLFDCRKAHAYYSDRDSVYIFLLFGGNSSDYYYDRLCQGHQHLLHPENFSAVFEFLLNIIHETETSLPEEHLISAGIHRLLALLVTPRDSHSSLNSERIRTVIEYMKEHLDQNITLNDIAAQVGLNPQYLSRLFRKYTETAPYDYLLNLRIARAEDLLTTTTDSIASIGDACGFRDTSHFIKLFKEKVQTTPLNFRKTSQPYKYL